MHIIKKLINVPCINTIKFILNHPANKSNKIKSMLRFVRWQIGSRLVAGPVIYTWLNSSKLIVRTGERGLTGNIYCGLHEFEEMSFLLHYLRSSDLFVDIGSNAGAYTILASAVIGANSISIEPIPSTYKRLVDNVRINIIEDKVKSYNIGLGEKAGVLHFSAEEDCCNHVLADKEAIKGKIIDVNVMSLDEVLAHHNPALLKIDVEGYETMVIKGALSTLMKKSLIAIIMELNGAGARYGFDELDIIELMSEYGFDAYDYSPQGKKIALKVNNKLTGNTIFIKDLQEVIKRIKTAPEFVIGSLII